MKEFRHTDAYGLNTIISDITLLDRKNRFVPTACNELTVTADANTIIVGVGNGDPAFQAAERPVNDCKEFKIKAFNGHAQVIVESRDGMPMARITM